MRPRIGSGVQRFGAWGPGECVGVVIGARHTTSSGGAASRFVAELVYMGGGTGGREAGGSGGGWSTARCGGTRRRGRSESSWRSTRRTARPESFILNPDSGRCFANRCSRRGFRRRRNDSRPNAWRPGRETRRVSPSNWRRSTLGSTGGFVGRPEVIRSGGLGGGRAVSGEPERGLAPRSDRNWGCGLGLRDRDGCEVRVGFVLPTDFPRGR